MIIQKLLARFLLSVLTANLFLMSFNPLIANAETKINLAETYNYSSLMREIRNTYQAKDLQRKKDLQDEIKKFREAEEDKLQSLKIDQDRIDQYFQLLDKQDYRIDPNLDHASQYYQEVFKVDDKTLQEIEKRNKEIQLGQIEPHFLDKPSSFGERDQKVNMEKFKTNKVLLDENWPLTPEQEKLFSKKVAHALEDNSMPSLNDLSEDQEVVIDSSIRELARDLNHNPVEIFEYIHNNIDYEPYFGAEKGSLGCLQTKSCNDTDSASLTIALMRASGIPARYGKTGALMSASQFKEILGVDQNKTTFYAFSKNHIPVYAFLTIFIGNPDFDTIDMESVDYFIVDWTYPEIFYEYDHRGGNINNTLDLSDFSTEEELWTALRTNNKKQWIPLDPTVKTYERIDRQIVPDAENFSLQNFWYNFLEYQGDDNPYEKLKGELLTLSGKNINSNSYRSKKLIKTQDFDILPPRLPYLQIEGVADDGYSITTDSFSTLPETRRNKVRVSLEKYNDQSQVISTTIPATLLNNQGFSLHYKGATETDDTVIESYGGIHKTPAPLVNIAPYFSEDFANSTPDQSVTIGEQLVLQFDHIVRDETKYTGQKLAIAGNSEGIFISLGPVSHNAFLDDESDSNMASYNLYEGNWAIARQHLRRTQEQMTYLAEALNHSYRPRFSRAVVTQQRILDEVAGTPTGFDFGGLMIDSSSLFTNFSNFDDYNTHRKDFRMLTGLIASHDEATVLEDLSNLNSISTVPGLQMAHGNPSEYTIHTIDSSNQSEIDSLNFSANTKAKMHQLIDDEDRTIITPQKPVETGEFSGILYIALHDDGSALYAIGEQVANGGWTEDALLHESIPTSVSYDVGGTGGGIEIAFESCSTQALECLEYFGTEYFDVFFGFTEPGRSEDSVLCSSDLNWRDEIILNSGIPVSAPIFEKWNIAFGSPCFEKQNYIDFNGQKHRYIVAANGAKFIGEGPSNYSYWAPQSIVQNQILGPVEYPNSGESYITRQNNGKANFRFNQTAGTYWFSDTKNKYAQYYQPIQPELSTSTSWYDNGRSRIVSKNYLDELTDVNHLHPNVDQDDATKSQYVVALLGYPISDTIQLADELGSGQKITYQDFAGGRIYDQENLLGGVLDAIFDKNQQFYIDGRLLAYYDTHSAHNSIFGLPIDDPKQGSGVIFSYQDFETGRLELRTQGANLIPSEADPEYLISSQYIQDLPLEYWEGFWDQFIEEQIAGAFAYTAGFGGIATIRVIRNAIAKKYGWKVAMKVGARFVPAVGWAFFSYSVYATADEVIHLHNACSSNIPIIENDGSETNPGYYCGKRDAVIALVGAGIISNTEAAAKLADAVLKTSTLKGRLGKEKLLGFLDTDAKIDTIIRIGRNSSKNIRNKFFDIFNRIPDEDIDLLLSRPNYMEEVGTSLSAETFNGFNKIGTYFNHAQYRWRPQYESEAALYGGINSFDTNKLRQANLLKSASQGTFYEMSELNQVLNIYNSNNLKDLKGEIIFVIKKDGTVKMAPRRDLPERDALPHPHLADGEDVLSAGAFRPVDGNKLMLSNKTGHYLVNKDDIDIMENLLINAGYQVEYRGPDDFLKN